MSATENEAIWTAPFIRIMLGMFFLFIPYLLYMPVLPTYLLEEMHSSVKTAGAVNAVFLLAAVIFRSLTVRLESRYGVRPVIVVCGILFTASSLLYLIAGSVAGIMAIRFASGALFAILNTSVMALGSRLIPPLRRGEGLAYLTTMVLVGGTIGPYIGINLSQTYGYNSVFIFTALSTLLGLFIVGFVPVEKGIRTPAVRFVLSDLYEIKALPVSLIILFIAVTYGGVLTFMALYAMELHLPLVTDYFFVVMAGSSVVSRLATGRMFDRFGANVSIYTAILLLSGGLLLLGTVVSTPLMLAAAAMIGIGYGGAVPSFQALAVQLSPPHRSSAVTATFFTCLDGGIGLGAYVLGGGIQRFGYAPVYLVLGIAVLACTVPYYFVHGRGGRSR